MNDTPEEVVPEQHGLPPLFPKNDLPDLLEHILRNVCHYPRNTNATLRPLPEKCELFSRFPVRRVVKKSQVGKDKSIKGYVWVDTDPIACLFNRYIAQSCHTLDNTEYQYRTGNFNYLYHPCIATVYAGPMHPATTPTKDAKSPCTGEYTKFNGEAVQIRPHQACANIALMRDENNRPYLFLGRLYDSAQEYPWAHSILRYAVAHCKRLGIGLALGQDTWDYYRKNSAETVRTYGAEPYDTIKLRTPPGVVPLGIGSSAPSLLPGYGVGSDGDNYMRWAQDEAKSFYYGDGNSILAPTTGFADMLAFPLLTTGDRLAYDADAPSLRTCTDCDCDIDEDDSHRDDDGDYYCDNCYHERFTRCDRCESYFPCDDVRSTDNGNCYCEYCYNSLFSDCDNCGDSTRKDDLETVYYVCYEGARPREQEVCSACAEDASVCENCDDRYIGASCGETGTLNGEPGCWVCPDCIGKLEAIDPEDVPDTLTGDLFATAPPYSEAA